MSFGSAIIVHCSCDAFEIRTSPHISKGFVDAAALSGTAGFAG